MKRLLLSCALATLAACTPAPTQEAAPPPPASAQAIAPVPTAAPAGDYTLDPEHSSLVLRVDHISFSTFVQRFAKFAADLHFDPANPTASSISASVETNSWTSDTGTDAKFAAMVQGKEWLDAAGFPAITFRSTNVDLTGPDTARVTGDLTLHGITKPITLDAKFNGGYAGNQYEPRARLGMSAHGVIKRSDFGITIGLPPPGSSLGVSDAVEIAIETEFTGPALTHVPAQ